MFSLCFHRKLTFPQTRVVRNSQGQIIARRGCFSVCPDCGRKFEYDPVSMSRTKKTRIVANARARTKSVTG